MKIGDRVRVNEKESLYKGCEGIIIEIDGDGSYIVELYKGNDVITEEEIKEYDVYFNEDELDLIVRLDVKNLRNVKNTTFISTSESLEGISRWLKYNGNE